MKIVRCNSCGRYRYDVDVCFQCGNKSGYEEVHKITLPRNLSLKLEAAMNAHNEKDYSKVVNITYEIAEWRPDLPCLFWLRLLAKSGCATTGELIKMGASSEMNPEFCNALLFSKGEEREIFMDIQKIVVQAVASLTDELSVHECMQISNTDILTVQEHIWNEIPERKKQLFALVSELQSVEHELMEAEVEAHLIAAEYDSDLEWATRCANTLKFQFRDRVDLSDKENDILMVRIRSLMQQSNGAVQSLKRMQSDASAYRESETHQNEIIKKIQHELIVFTSYLETVRKVIDRVDAIKLVHQEARKAVNNGEFIMAESLLGTERFTKILSNAGLYVGT